VLKPDIKVLAENKFTAWSYQGCLLVPSASFWAAPSWASLALSVHLLIKTTSHHVRQPLCKFDKALEHACQTVAANPAVRFHIPWLPPLENSLEAKTHHPQRLHLGF